MRARSAVERVVLAALLSACAGGSPPPPSATPAPVEGDEPGATRASREAAHAEPAATVLEAGAPDAPATFTVTALGAVADAEDGMGARVAATDAVAVDLDARRFRPRALDPVLEVGALRFVHYEHPEAGVLRFVLADGAVLDRGEPIAIQYGHDARSRVVLVPAGSRDESSSSTGAVVP